ncbi:hypothetical protein MTO96_008451 [Rhipicephalus appendiculatus]
MCRHPRPNSTTMEKWQEPGTSAESSDAGANTLSSLPTPAILSRWQPALRRDSFSGRVCKDQRPPWCRTAALRCTSGLLG